MKNIIGYILLLELLIIPALLINAPTVSAAEGPEPAKDVDGKYQIRIEESQWSIKALYEDKNGKEQEVEGKIGPFEKGSTVVFTVLTRDVQHGFSINEMNVAVATNRPKPGDDFGEPVIVEALFPNEDVTYSAFCHIFCGLGHPDMKLKFVIGEGSFESGPIVYYSVIALNIGIFAVVARAIFTKVKSSKIKEVTT